MKTFSVIITIGGATEISVEAENEEEAEEKVNRMIDDDEILLPFEITDIDISEIGGEKS